MYIEIMRHTDEISELYSHFSCWRHGNISTESWFADVNCFVAYFCLLFVVRNELFFAYVIRSKLDYFLVRVHNRKVKPVLGDAPPPVLTTRVVSLTLPHWVVLVESRNLHEKWHIACFLVPIVCIDHEDASSVLDGIWTKIGSDEFGSSLGCNSGFANISKHVCRIFNRR